DQPARRHSAPERSSQSATGTPLHSTDATDTTGGPGSGRYWPRPSSTTTSSATRDIGHPATSLTAADAASRKTARRSTSSGATVTPRTVTSSTVASVSSATGHLLNFY